MLFEAGLSFWSGGATRYLLDSGYDTGFFKYYRSKFFFYNF